jgi:hypothetical protein
MRTMEDRKKLVKVGGLWKGKAGTKTVASGKLELGGREVRVWIFRNEDKKESKHPDFRVVAEEEPGFTPEPRGRRSDPGAYVPDDGFGAPSGPPRAQAARPLPRASEVPARAKAATEAFRATDADVPF